MTVYIYIPQFLSLLYRYFHFNYNFKTAQSIEKNVFCKFKLYK